MLAPKGIQLLGAVAVTAAVGFGAFQVFNKGTRSDTVENKGTKTEAVVSSEETNAPLANVSPATETLQIEDPSQPSEFKLESGATISVPANAFENNAGELVTEPVRLTYQELNTPEAIIAADIPMQVQKDKVEGDWLQTAGMFEVRAFANGENVAVANGKALTVEISTLAEGEYGVWQYDEENEIWLTDGTTSEAFPSDSPEAELLREEILDLKENTRVAPVKPQADAANEQLIFSDLDVSKCPDFKKGEEIRLAYTGSDESLAPKNNQWISNPNTWFKKELLCTDKDGVYTLKLFGEKIYEIPVRRALEGVRLESAVRDYQRKLENYREQVAQLRDAQNRLALSDGMRRSMRVLEMGIHNYDVLLDMEEQVNLNADFNFEDMPELVKDGLKIYQVTGDNRTVVALTERTWKRFRFDPNMENKLIAVLTDDKVAMFTEADFKAQEDDLRAANGGGYTFDMDVRDGQVDSVEDLEEFLLQAEGIKMYPNPVRSDLTVEYQTSASTSSYSVYTQSGQLVKQGNSSNEAGENQLQLNVADLSAGNYYLQLDGSRAQPFVVAK